MAQTARNKVECNASRGEANGLAWMLIGWLGSSARAVPQYNKLRHLARPDPAGSLWRTRAHHQP